MGTEFDENGLRPATVEELAAAERAAVPSRKDRGKRPFLVALATALLLVAGAGALAIARADSEPTMVQPKGPAAPFGVGYVDGFGEHSPNPTRSAKPRPPKPKPTTARPTPSSSFDIFVSESPESKQDEVLTANGLSAVYWTDIWSGYYDLYVWVHNDGPDPVDWQVRIKLPGTATITAAWETSRVGEPGNVWTFTSPYKTKLAPGRTYLFAFEGTRPAGPFQLGFCTVNGGACTAFS